MGKDWPWRALIDAILEEDDTRPLVDELHGYGVGRIDGVLAQSSASTSGSSTDTRVPLPRRLSIVASPPNNWARSRIPLMPNRVGSIPSKSNPTPQSSISARTRS